MLPLRRNTYTIGKRSFVVLHLLWAKESNWDHTEPQNNSWTHASSHALWSLWLTAVQVVLDHFVMLPRLCSSGKCRRVISGSYLLCWVWQFKRTMDLSEREWSSQHQPGKWRHLVYKRESLFCQIVIWNRNVSILNCRVNYLIGEISAFFFRQAFEFPYV